MRGLLAVERMVLESIAAGKKKLNEIAKDTELREAFVKLISSNLINYGLVKFEKNEYFLSSEKRALRDVNQSSFVKEEVKDLFNSLVENYFLGEEGNSLLKMQKIWLTDGEEKILKGMMYNIESYISSIRKDRLLNPENENRAKQKVIFWGSDTYQNLIERVVKAG